MLTTYLKRIKKKTKSHEILMNLIEEKMCGHQSGRIASHDRTKIPSILEKQMNQSSVCRKFHRISDSTSSHMYSRLWRFCLFLLLVFILLHTSMAHTQFKFESIQMNAYQVLIFFSFLPIWGFASERIIRFDGNDDKKKPNDDNGLKNNKKKTDSASKLYQCIVF